MYRKTCKKIERNNKLKKKKKITKSLYCQKSDMTCFFAVVHFRKLRYFVEDFNLFTCRYRWYGTRLYFMHLRLCCFRCSCCCSGYRSCFFAENNQQPANQRASALQLRERKKERKNFPVLDRHSIVTITHSNSIRQKRLLTKHVRIEKTSYPFVNVCDNFKFLLTAPWKLIVC